MRYRESPGLGKTSRVACYQADEAEAPSGGEDVDESARARRARRKRQQRRADQQQNERGSDRRGVLSPHPALLCLW